jgi:hypothetical protein
MIIFWYNIITQLLSYAAYRYTHVVNLVNLITNLFTLHLDIFLYLCSKSDFGERLVYVGKYQFNLLYIFVGAVIANINEILILQEVYCYMDAKEAQVHTTYSISSRCMLHVRFKNIITILQNCSVFSTIIQCI